MIVLYNHRKRGIQKKVMRKKIIAVIIVLIGLGLLCYPWISNYLFENSVDSTVQVYEKSVEEIDAEELEAMLEEAREYNRNLESSARVQLTDPFIAAEEEKQDSSYDSILNLNGDGMICSIEIPKINVSLPVYHSTASDVLDRGAGHLEGSSFPVGGTDTHAVISAHTGLNRAKMFTDLVDLEEGDLFFIKILNETLAYRVCDINVVLPNDTSLLQIQEGRDLVSLVTCTPYGQNTHRLIVTGERTEYTEEIEEEARSQTSDATSQWMDEYRKALIIGLLIILITVIVSRVSRKMKERKKYRPWRRGGI